MSQSSKRDFHDSEIKEIIQQYKQHECLWNINSPDYKSRCSKQNAWLEIAFYFQKDVNEMKRKVHYLRTAYVHAKRRVDAARKTGSKAHKPSLFYYKELDFLDDMVIWRKFGNDSNAKVNAHFERVEMTQDVEENEFITIDNNESDYLKEPEFNCKIEAVTEPEINVKPPPQIVKSTPKITHIQSLASRPEKRKNVNIDSVKSVSTNASSTNISVNPQTENLYISFGKTIALQLQHLPLEDAILAMSEIHTILTEKTLKHIRSLKNDTESESENNYSEFIEETVNDSS